MSHSDQDIPTLTSFIRIGDEDMQHHFGAQQFNIDQDEPWAPTDAVAFNENAFSADNFSHIDLADGESEHQIHSTRPGIPGNEIEAAEAEVTASDSAEFDPLHIAAVEIDQVPAELAPFDPALVEDSTPTDDSDEYLELDVQEVISPAMPSIQMSADELGQHQSSGATPKAIRQQIDQAVDELLPSMAEQLKQHLYRHFKCQSDTD